MAYFCPFIATFRGNDPGESSCAIYGNCMSGKRKDMKCFYSV